MSYKLTYGYDPYGGKYGFGDGPKWYYENVSWRDIHNSSYSSSPTSYKLETPSCPKTDTYICFNCWKVYHIDDSKIYTDPTLKYTLCSDDACRILTSDQLNSICNSRFKKFVSSCCDAVGNLWYAAEKFGNTIGKYEFKILNWLLG